ncbi:class I SAM-dependent methyltransferase [Nocardia sp. NPDC050406]|uniref:class I SAM-dependent methyltransferase n=1 Tax=Nocardia sp. NPDC050406 TaxID=3364318 RepID=UPI0037B2199E
MTWWAELYDELLAEHLLVRAEGEVEPTLDFLVERLDIAPGSRVFDQCCGIGSLAVPLAARGFDLVGVDQAASYIERARADARTAGVAAEFVAADACDYAPAKPVDAVFNWWTSFGYGSDAENQRMLDRAFDALRPGGRFALDTMNLPGVLRGFRRDTVTRRTTPLGEVLLVRETSVDLAEGRMLKDWTYFVDGKFATRHHSSVRLYLPDTIVAMLRAAGFHDIDLYGDLSGGPLHLDSPRCILLARRPS